LQQLIARNLTEGWRLESTIGNTAVMVSGNKPNHILHLLLKVFTIGLWAPIWAIVAITTDERRITVYADEYGRVGYAGPAEVQATSKWKSGPVQAAILGGAVLLLVLISIAVAQLRSP